MLVEYVARVCHEANESLCVTQGDYSQPSWDDAPEWQKRSIIEGVKFHLENPDASPSAGHENWLKEKQEDGWEYGDVKDVEAKKHPCFVPFEQLPESQKAKDHLFKAIVDGLRGFVKVA